jgi:glycerophosphoryl diester phosphodiesterase
VVATLALIAALDIIWFIIGKIVHVMLMADFYRETTDGKQKLGKPVPAAGILSPTGLKRIGWLIVGIVLIMGVVAGAAFLEGFNINRTIEITGHRGSKVRAPENTLSALRQAIAEGADYAEIDVQTTADGVVVLLHDADLMRVASVNRRLRDINYRELKDIDAGSWFAPEFSSERIPTLQAKWIFFRLCGQFIEFSGFDGNQTGFSGTRRRFHRLQSCREPAQDGSRFSEH